MRVVAERHRPLAARTSEHVEVVHRVTRCRDARPVVAARNAEHVAVVDHDVDVDLTIRRVRAVHAEPFGRVVTAAGNADAEVVDLLVVHGAFR
jgi:hypothetical protein